MNKYEPQDFPEVVCLQGERLKKAREARGESVDQIASKLHLPVSYVRAIEDGRIKKLPSLVFARGYIRSYASLVGIDPKPILGELDEHFGSVVGSQNVKSVATVKRQVTVTDTPVRWFTVLLVIVILMSVVWWWDSQHGVSFGSAADESKSVVVDAGGSEPKGLLVPKADSNGVAEPEAATGAPSVSEGQASADAAVTSEQQEEEPRYLSDEEIKKLQADLDKAEDPSPETVGGGTEAPAETLALEPVGDTAEQATTEVVGETGHLTMTFGGDCWVSIKDAKGRTLVASVRSPTRDVDVSGQLPFTLRIGAASEVSTITLNNRVVDLTPHTVRNVARLQLPIAE